MVHFSILNINSGYVLDIASFNGDVGQIKQYRSHGGSNQLWTHQDGILFCNFQDGYILEINENTKKLQAVPVARKNGERNQIWYFDNDGIIRNGTGLVLDILGGQEVEEQEVIVQSKQGSKSQQFAKIFIRI